MNDGGRVHPLVAIVLAMQDALDREMYPPERGNFAALKKIKQSDQRAPKQGERWAA